MEILKRAIVLVLTWESRLVILRHKPHIIAVIGSVGKTTTKDAIFAAVSSRLHARKSAKSYNSEIGVPLTILGIENAWHNPVLWLWNIVHSLKLLFGMTTYPAWLVLEIGADRPGDIRKVARWLRPDIVVLTGVSEIPVHVE